MRQISCATRQSISTMHKRPMPCLLSHRAVGPTSPRQQGIAQAQHRSIVPAGLQTQAQGSCLPWSWTVPKSGQPQEMMHHSKALLMIQMDSLHVQLDMVGLA